MTMPLTGHKIREAINTWELRRDTLERDFTDSLTFFPGETKENPNEIMNKLVKVEQNVARLHALLSQYNTSVSVKAQGTDLSLANAVRLISGAERVVKLWKSVFQVQENRRFNRYGDRSDVRKKEDLYPEKAVTSQHATEEAAKAQKFANALRAAIATGNTITVHFAVEETLFE